MPEILDRYPQGVLFVHGKDGSVKVPLAEYTLDAESGRNEAIRMGSSPLPRTDTVGTVSKVHSSYVKLDAHLELPRGRHANELPPRSGEFILLLLPKAYRGSLVGDLEEEYRTILLPEHGRARATFWYWAQVASALASWLWDLAKKFLGIEIFHRLIR